MRSPATRVSKPQTPLIRHAALMVTLIVCGGLYLSTIDSYGMLMWDEAHYATLARSLARGEGYMNYKGEPDTFRPPVVPTAAAISLRLTGSDSDRAAKIPIVVFSLLCIALVYRALGDDTGTFCRIAGAISLAIFPDFWQATASLLTEIPFMLFYGAAVFYFFEGLYRDHRSFWLAWSCWGLAVLTRYTAVLYGPTVVLLSLMPIVLRDTDAIKRMWTKEFFLAPGLGFLIISPWLVRTWVYTGDPLQGFRYAAGQIPAYSHAVMSPFYYAEVLPHMLGWIPLLLLVGAAVYCIAVRTRLGLACLLAASVVIGWMTQYEWKEPRLITSALPFFAILIGLGVDALAHAWTKAPGDKGRAMSSTATWGLQHLIVILIFGAAFFTNYRSASAVLRGTATLGYPSFLRAMEFLRREIPQDAVLLAPNCHQVYWYTDRRCRGFPSERSDLAEALRQADWVIITTFERGQPKYVREELRRFGSTDYATGTLKPFADSRSGTVLLRAEVLRARRGDLPPRQQR